MDENKTELTCQEMEKEADVPYDHEEYYKGN